MKISTISLVIPVHNEVNTIEQVIRNYYAEVISKIPGSEFIIAEDGSNDGTKEVLQRLVKELPITLVSSNERKGYAKAVRDALRLPKNEIVFFSDSDAQHKVSDFWKLLPFIEDFDIVTGYKCPRIDSALRVFISRIMNALIYLMFGVFYRDINSGFKLYRKSALEVLLNNYEGLDFISTELLIKAYILKMKIAEVPVLHYKREFGESRGLPSSKLPIAISKLLLGLLRIRLRLLVWRKL